MATLMNVMKNLKVYSKVKESVCKRQHTASLKDFSEKVDTEALFSPCHLEELILEGISMTPAVATALCRLLPETPSLRILSLTEIYVSNIRAEEMFIELIDRALRSPLLFNFNLNLV